MNRAYELSVANHVSCVKKMNIKIIKNIYLLVRKYLFPLTLTWRFLFILCILIVILSLWHKNCSLLKILIYRVSELYKKNPHFRPKICSLKIFHWNFALHLLRFLPRLLYYVLKQSNFLINFCLNWKMFQIVYSISLHLHCILKLW